MPRADQMDEETLGEKVASEGVAAMVDSPLSSSTRPNDCEHEADHAGVKGKPELPAANKPRDQSRHRSSRGWKRCASPMRPRRQVAEQLWTTRGSPPG